MAAGEAEEGGEGKVSEGTGLGEGDTTDAKDISKEVRGVDGVDGCLCGWGVLLRWG
jgi:hypothetical protein